MTTFSPVGAVSVARAAVLVLACLSFAACGGTGSTVNPIALCTEVNRRDCALAFECLSADDRSMGGYPSSEAECITRGEEIRGCPGKTETNSCASGGTYQGAGATACVDEWEAATCATYATANPNSACNSVCQ